MNNGNWFQWAVGGLLIALFLVAGAILHNFDNRITVATVVQAEILKEVAVLSTVHSDMREQLRYIREKVDLMEKRTR